MESRPLSYSLEALHDPLWTCESVNRCKSSSNGFLMVLKTNACKDLQALLKIFKMSFQNPHLAPQKDTLSVASETVPLYHLGAIKQEVALDESCCHEDGSQLISLSGILETAFNNEAESGTTNATFTSVFDGSSSSITHGCPDNCPCVCHVPAAPCIPFNQARPSVIMTPVAGRRRASGATSTHAPLQIGENLDSFVNIAPNQCVDISKEETESNENTDTIPHLEQSKDNKKVDEVWTDSEGEQRFLRVDTNGLKTRFKLSKQDWDLMEITHFPGGGRLLGGAWTTIFKRGLHESNPWCNLRLKNNHVRKEKSRKMISAPFFRGSGNCKRRECDMKFKMVIEEERGKYVDVTYTGNVFHKHKSYPAKG